MFVVLSLVWFVLLRGEIIGPAAFLVLLVVNVPLIWAMVLLVHRATAGTARES